MIRISAGQLRIVAIAVLVAVLGLALVTGRAIVEGEAEMTKSDGAFNEGDLRMAILHARRAATLYAPGAPHVSAAYERLVAIANGAEATGRRDAAQSAWRAVRAAALETRHVRVPHQAELDLANRALARLSARAQDARNPAPDGASATAVNSARALRELNQDAAPRAGWLLALVVGFALSLAGVALFAVRAVGPDGKVALRPARIGLIVAALGAACWTLAVLRA
jgi:hypothetical protein